MLQSLRGSGPEVAGYSDFPWHASRVLRAELPALTVRTGRKQGPQIFEGSGGTMKCSQRLVTAGAWVGCLGQVAEVAWKAELQDFVA